MGKSQLRYKTIDGAPILEYLFGAQASEFGWSSGLQIIELTPGPEFLLFSRTSSAESFSNQATNVFLRDKPRIQRCEFNPPYELCF
jgi:hypothetical protein